MSVLIPVEIDANYDKDRDLLGKLNKHLDIGYSEDTDRINFTIDLAEDDHYVIVSVSLGDLIEAIGKAKQLSEPNE
jgi:hypothetical protein